MKNRLIQPLHRYAPLCLAGAASLLGSTLTAAEPEIIFNITPGPALAALQAGNPLEQERAANIMDGFTEAANIWRGVLHDPVTLNLTLEYTETPPDIGGAALPEFLGIHYADSLYPALLADVSGVIDQAAVASLPAPLPTGVPFMTNDTTVVPSPRFFDNDGSNNNTFFTLTRAQSKALSLIPRHDPASDGLITINNRVPFDFDRSNGISSNQIDYLRLAAHEIGHVLGFFSGVDSVDAIGGDGNPPEGPVVDQHIDLDPFSVFTPLDLFRYTDDSLSQPNQPLGGLNEGAFGQPAPGDQPFFSIDGGLTELATFSAGQFNGDRRQASHWQDDLSIGILDPSLAPGELLTLSNLDIIAMDVIGWDREPIPEPYPIYLLIAGSMFGALRRPGPNCRRCFFFNQGF